MLKIKKGKVTSKFVLISRKSSLTQSVLTHSNFSPNFRFSDLASLRSHIPTLLSLSFLMLLLTALIRAFGAFPFAMSVLAFKDRFRFLYFLKLNSCSLLFFINVFAILYLDKIYIFLSFKTEKRE